MKEETKNLKTLSSLSKILVYYKTILYYCLKCRKSIENKKPKVLQTKNGKIMLLSKCTVCGSKKSKFIKEQEASALLISLEMKTPFSKIPLVGPLLY